MSRAPSRLNRTNLSPKQAATPHSAPVIPDHAIRAKHVKKPALIQKYLSHTPMLFLSAACYLLLWLIINNFYPRQAMNFLWPGSFIPVTITFFGGTFFLVSFILLNSKLGFMISSLLTIGLFLKLQGFSF